MGKVLKAVAGVVLIVVGAVLDAFGQEYGSFFIKAGAALLLNAAAEALAPRPPRQKSVLTPQDVSYTGTLEPRRIVYGQVKISGMNCIPPWTSGASNEYLHQVLALTGHAVTSIGDIYFNQTRIPASSLTAISSSANDGKVTTGSYANIAWIRAYDGTQSTEDFILNSNFGAWDTNHKGQGIAYLALQYMYNPSIYSSGLPQVTCIVKGKKVYDPRQDSTNGGSGAQRIASPATWTYSTNPALCLRDYLTSSLGLGESQSRIDDVLVAAAANTCDELVSVPLPPISGTVDWTNSSAILAGNSTQFLSELAVGNYLKSPSGTMYLISAIASDISLTLSSSYSGSTATNQTTLWNTSSLTSTAQSRYTCNIVLEATANYQDVIATLAGAMMGNCVYSSGKWRMYAGSWFAPAFTLNEDDLVGGITVQCSTPRKDLYNCVRGNYIEPEQNYQPTEFPPIINSSYITADGDTIYLETNYPACQDRYEAQRNSIVLGRKSRNQRVVVAQYGMSSYGVKVRETGIVTIAEIGWTDQSVECIGWKFTPNGVIELTLREAYSTDWDDPIVSDYSTNAIGAQPMIPIRPTLHDTVNLYPNSATDFGTASSASGSQGSAAYSGSPTTTDYTICTTSYTNSTGSTQTIEVFAACRFTIANTGAGWICAPRLTGTWTHTVSGLTSATDEIYAYSTQQTIADGATATVTLSATFKTAGSGTTGLTLSWTDASVKYNVLKR